MVRAIVGANWGDEGKGKITDMLGEQSDIIIRFQGGSNAGHTIIDLLCTFFLQEFSISIQHVSSEMEWHLTFHTYKKRLMTS